jgi:hypothetical protein
MTLSDQVNEICGRNLCTKAARRKSDGARVFVGAGACRTIAAYNLLVSAVRQLGGGIVRWNGQEREVEA